MSDADPTHEARKDAFLLFGTCGFLLLAGAIIFGWTRWSESMDEKREAAIAAVKQCSLEARRAESIAEERGGPAVVDYQRALKGLDVAKAEAEGLGFKGLEIQIAVSEGANEYWSDARASRESTSESLKSKLAEIDEKYEERMREIDREEKRELLRIELEQARRERERTQALMYGSHQPATPPNLESVESIANGGLPVGMTRGSDSEAAVIDISSESR